MHRPGCPQLMSADYEEREFRQLILCGLCSGPRQVEAMSLQALLFVERGTKVLHCSEECGLQNKRWMKVMHWCKSCFLICTLG